MDTYSVGDRSITIPLPFSSAPPRRRAEEAAPLRLHSPYSDKILTSAAASVPATPSTTELVERAKAAEEEGIMQRSQHHLDAGVDWVDAKVEAGTEALASTLEDVPLLGQLAQAQAWGTTQATQLVGGIVKGAGSLAFGLGTMVLHPWDTAQGLFYLGKELVTHPLKGGELLAKAVTEPYAKEIEQGKYAEAIGRGIFDIGTLVLGPSMLRRGAASKTVSRLSPQNAAAIAQLKDPDVFYRALAKMPANELQQLVQLEPKVGTKFTAMLAMRQQTMLKEINVVLSRYGVEASGRIKTWQSAINKLENDTVANLAQGRSPAVLGDLNDLARARVNVQKLDPIELRQMATEIQEAITARFGDREFRFVVKDSTQDEIFNDPQRLYRGRINMQIQDWTEGTKNGSFELQLGPQQYTDYSDKTFKLASAPKHLSFSVHDADYKGFSRLTSPEHFSKIGRDLPGGKALSEAEAILQGRAYVEGTIKANQQLVQHVIDQALAGKPLNYPEASRPLRDRIEVIYQALKDDPNLPVGLRGH